MSQTGVILNTHLYSKEALKLRKSFQSRIVGQDEATDALTNALEKHLSGFADPRRPIASLLFLGPTGTGKTSCVEALCEGLFGFRDAMVKIDCAEFQHSHEVAKLVGSPPGYLGHRETPARLTQESVNQFQTTKMPISIILFDEIEKASDAVWQLMLNILDKGLLTLGNNNTTNFTKCIIVMTSNVGSREMATKAGEGIFGFQGTTIDDVDDKELKNISMSAAKRKFTPEFLNRLDEIVMFNTLTREQIVKITELELDKVQATMFGKGVIPTFSPAAKEEILKQGYDKTYNARFLRRTIEKRIMMPIARAFSSKQLKYGDNLIVDARNGEFEFLALDGENVFTRLAKEGVLQP